MHGIMNKHLFDFWENIVYRYIRKTKAHSLVCGRVVAPLPRVRTLVLGVRVTYMRNSYKNVNFKAHNQLLVITSHTLLKLDK